MSTSAFERNLFWGGTFPVLRVKQNQLKLQTWWEALNVWQQQIYPSDQRSDSKRHFLFLCTQLIFTAEYKMDGGSDVGGVCGWISMWDRVTSRCGKWVRDYPAGSHKHWGCESTWQRSDASWSPCRPASPPVALTSRTDLWPRCSLAASEKNSEKKNPTDNDLEHCLD